MRAVIQRVTSSNVVVDAKTVGSIEKGLLVLLGVEQGDTPAELDYLVNKTLGLRIFEDNDEKMNLSVVDVSGEILVVSQFTLLGDVRKGKRPSFIRAADPPVANEMYEQYVEKLRATGMKVETGIFAADMKVSLVNDGPVTILIDSKKVF